MEETYSDLPITNDFMFTRVMQDPEICKGFLEEVLPDIRISRLEYLEPQKSLENNVDAHGVRLDVYVEDENKVYDIEMQTVPQSDLARRARYYQGHMDMDLLKKGEQYDTLKDSYIIFVCTFDPFHQSQCLYSFENRCLQVSGLKLEDGAHKLFVNTKGKKGKDNPDFKKLLDYFESRPVEQPTELIRKMETAVKTANQDKGWRREVMNLELKMYDRERIGIQKGRREGMQKGMQKGKEEVALNLLGQNLPMELIAGATGLSVEELKKLKSTLPNEEK